MDRVRILYIIGSSDIGGAENFVYTFLKSLNNDKFEKYVVCPADGYYAEKYKSLSKKALFINPKRSFMNLGTILRVSKFIKNNNIDITHTMLYGSDFCGVLAHLISRRSYILNTINGLNFLVLEKNSLRLKRRIASLVYRLIYRYSDKLIAVSESVRQDLINRKGIKVSPQKIVTVLAAGTETSYHDFSQEYVKHLRDNYLREKELAISAIGTLNEVKDYDSMLEAFSLASKKNSKMRLFIAGDGPEKERLQKKASDLGICTRVYFLGALEERERNALLYLTDIFIMSSKTEGCPTSLLEAMYFEKPIIATKVGGIPEIIKHEESGLLISERDPQSLADTILDIAENQIRRIQFGKRAKQVFEERFTQQHMLKAYNNIYNSLLIKK